MCFLTDWEACRDRYGRIFYLDHKNRRTQWERPASAAEEVPVVEADDVLSDEAGLVESLPLPSKPLLRQRRYNSVKGDRNYERVMRRYRFV